MNGIQLTIAGNVTRDPEISTVGNGATLAKFSIAVERSWKNEQTGDWDKATSFVDVVAWRFIAEDVERLLQKGMRVVVSGRLDQQSWEDKDTGKTRNRFELTADEIAISSRAIDSLERRTYDGAANGGRTAQRPAAAASRPSSSRSSGDDIWG